MHLASAVPKLETRNSKFEAIRNSNSKDVQNQREKADLRVSAAEFLTRLRVCLTRRSSSRYETCAPLCSDLRGFLCGLHRHEPFCSAIQVSESNHYGSGRI